MQNIYRFINILYYHQRISTLGGEDMEKQRYSIDAENSQMRIDRDSNRRDHTN